MECTWNAADYFKPQELDGSIILQRLVIGRNVTLLEEASVFGGDSGWGKYRANSSCENLRSSRIKALDKGSQQQVG